MNEPHTTENDAGRKEWISDREYVIHNEPKTKSESLVMTERDGLHAIWREAAEKGIEHGIDWPRVVLDLFRALDQHDAGVFVGSASLMRALHATVAEHAYWSETPTDGGAYLACACGWRSDDNYGRPEYAASALWSHLANALHAASVKALQPIVRRVLPPGSGRTEEATP